MNSNQSLTIVMYHYVRPILKTEHPNIKGLELEKFYKQLDYFEENYSIIDTEDVINSILTNKKLPCNACWLTFDDGYKDHIKYVMPELLKRKISGAFFPPKNAITESCMLDVNSIHFILSCNKFIDDLVTDLNYLCKQHGINDTKIRSFYKTYNIADRFDDANTMYVKRMLQYVLPEEIRRNIVALLFKKYVGVSQKNFSSKLYMNIKEVSELVKNGMYVGSHGSAHNWLNKINEDQQKKDIVSSLAFLEEIKAPTSNWIMCYPYGAYNKKIISLLKKLGASAGVTTEVRKAIIGKDNPLTLPRFDTNDFL
jgi:peptidoglycan/xylan/chitin deacetylase (PgdA/CDA1 family)